MAELPLGALRAEDERLGLIVGSFAAMQRTPARSTVLGYTPALDADQRTDRAAVRTHRTVTVVAALPDLPQSIFTGQVPGFVFDPTVHVHVMVFAVFAPRP